ncbi:murein hydrolase activator EnvC family protein [Desulfovibrio sp. TomC]|uniref:murein hydrolase activator EnvC family protein n=1 Tax=Desulfovibrio sp. TomC TaxID=1562888 RepID=UPI0005731A35|nr:peptidoglycan DD-metalloendopeptidase family protein [Desulfovibrio sp. TomC]KHK01233.1 Peptidase, M23/M37 family [Desulfovibrio sp. TomC]
MRRLSPGPVFAVTRRAVCFCLALLGALGLTLTLTAGPALARKPVAPDPAEARARLGEARARVAASEAETRRLSRQLAALEAARDGEGRRLASLLAALWPLRAESLAAGGPAGSDWAASDRRYVWTRSLYEAALTARQAFDAAAAKARQGRLARDDAALRLLAGQKESDRAFSDAVATRVRELENAPGYRVDNGAILLGQALESTIPPGDPQAPGAGGDAGPAVFAPPSGGLSWPTPGKVLVPFAAANQAYRQGMVLAAPQGSPVVAAAAGRVVFTGTLRGLGRVVILTHDDRCHTVYACLDSSAVSVGEAVSGGASLGSSGYCNQMRASGVYFELRFREKALNPAEWLAVRR